MPNCPIEKYINAYKIAAKKVVDINPGAPKVPLQLGVNEYWLGLKENPMTNKEKQVYRVLTESTNGLVRINMSYTTQIHEPLVMVKEIGNAYTVYLQSGKNYTFDKGSKTSTPTAKGRTVEMPYMGYVKLNKEFKVPEFRSNLYRSENDEKFKQEIELDKTVRMAIEVRDQRIEQVKDDAGWKRYEKEIKPYDGSYTNYYGALEKAIVKFVNPTVLPDVIGLMLKYVFRDNAVTAGEYNYETHTVSIAKQATEQELNEVADKMITIGFMNEYGVPDSTMKTELDRFINYNKQRVLKSLIDAVETVNGGHTLTHELIHAGSLNFIRANPKHPAVMRVNELYKEAMNNADDIRRMAYSGDVYSTYWQKNVEEFIAEALSNPGLMYALSNIKTVGKEKLSKGLFAELVKTLIEMLGLSKKTENNLLEFTMDGFTAIMEAQAVKTNVPVDKELKVTLKKALADMRGSDENVGIGTKKGDVKVGEEEIDLGQVLTDEFEAYLSFDEQEGKSIKTKEFRVLQDKVLKTYQETMQNLETGNVKIEMFENAKEATAGQVDLKTRELKMRWNNMSRLSRISEVFLHEVNHLVSSHVFKDNIKVRRLMEDLRDNAINSGVDYKLFLKGIANPTREEIALAKKKFEYTFDKTANVEEFYAYATTNEQVYNAIKDIEIKSRLIELIDMDPNKKAPFSKVLNRLIEVVNDIWRLMSGRGVKGGQMIADMVVTIARLDVEKAQMNWQAENSIEGISDYAKGKINQLDETLEPVISKVEEWSDKLSAKQSGKAIAKHLRKIPVLNELIATGISQYLWRMVTQDTTKQDVADMYMVFRHSKQMVDKHTSAITDGVKAVATDYYKDVDKETKNAVTRLIMEGDLAQFDAETLKMYLERNKAVTSEIANLERQILNTSTVKDVASTKAQIDGLAEYLISGKTTVHNQQFNANNIATNLMAGDKKLVVGAKVKTIELIDKLVSLKVLQNSDPVHKQRLLDMMQTAEGIDILNKTITMYRGYIDNMRDDATLGYHDPIPKGYTSAKEGLLRYELIPEEEIKAQESVLMKLVDTKPYAIVEGKKYYLMTGRTKSVGFNEGALGLISHTIDGIPVSQLIRKNNELSGKLGLLDGELKRKTKEIINAINNQDKDVMKKFAMGSGQTLIPVYNHQNEIVDYRIQLNKLEKTMYLPDRKTELEDVMSHTFSRSIKTTLTASENKKVIDEILINSANGILEKPDEYVLVEEYTEEDRRNGVKYEKRHDRWNYLPDHTKEYIYQKTRHKGISIHKDFVELMTGEKDVTIGNFVKFGIDMRKYPVARARLMALESYLNEVLGYVKNSMVVLNADVLLGNQTSNAIVAMTHGIGPIEYTKKFTERWAQLNDYNEKSQLLAELEVRKMAGENVDNRMAQLKKQLEGNVWDELVKDGQYTALVEDINIEGQGEGQLLTQARDWLEKKNWIGAVDNVKNVLYINRTSKLYNGLLKTVHYGDAITRQIIKEELEKKAVKKNGKVSKEVEREILNYLDQLLVNYGYTMNRWWKYAERIGGLFFMKYYLSQAKAIMSLTKRNPARTGVLQGAQWLTGLDFQDPIDTYRRSGIDGIGYRWMFDDVPGQILQPNIFDLIPDLGSIVKIK